jgi:RanBP-type and C3HC4-type zinc finger-containing protein 1
MPIMPKNDLNNVCIDLTESPENSQENAPQGKKKTSLHLDMELSSAGPKASRSKTNQLRAVENQPDYFNEPGPSHRVPHRVPLRQSINEPCYKKLQEMMEKPLIENSYEFICILCKMNVRIGMGVVLKECLHSFCRDCLIHVIERIPPGKLRVDCPNVPEICESFISMEEIGALLGEDKFEEFARKMTDETSSESLLPILLQMNDLAVIPNFKAFTCQVCYSDVEAGEGIILKNCLHNGCKDCLGQLIGHAEQFEVQCPYVENNIPCREYIQEQEMRFLTSEEVFDKHLKKSLKIAEHVNELNFHCRGINCEMFYELIPGLTAFECEVCKTNNCVPCKASHPGKSCLDYQEEMNPELKNNRLLNENKQSEETIAAEIAAGTAMLCPRCQIPVMKITGCAFITCTACKLG